MLMKNISMFVALAMAAVIGPAQITQADEKPFAKIVPALAGAPPEGFAIGRAFTAYTGSVDGSIYKVDLRTGQGDILVPAEPDFDLFTQCFKLGMRVDRRSNYLFAAGCLGGNAYVFDAETGEEIMQYQLAEPFSTVINDLAITRDAVYFTDFGQAFLYRLPLSRNGRLPTGADAAIPLPLTGDFVEDDPSGGLGNGIVATPDGKTLIVGNSNNARIYRVDPATGLTDRIVLDTPLTGFIDGIVLHGNMLFVLTPYNPVDPQDIDRIQLVELDEDLLSGSLVGSITDPDLDGVASGALFGNSLYVNNARYRTFPEFDTEYWITRLNIYNVQP